MPAVIFDMDGVLIDSEPLWKEAEIAVFGALGVPLTLKMTEETTGLGIEPVARLWFSRFPWSGESPDSVAARIKVRVTELITTRGRPQPGAQDLVRTLAAEGVRLAVCSSSSRVLIEAVLQVLELRACFEVLQSAEECSKGKPDPEPYLATARALGLPPTDCVVIEDSLNGMRAAKAAGCMVVGYCPVLLPGASDLCTRVIADHGVFPAAEVQKLLSGSGK